MTFVFGGKSSHSISNHSKLQICRSLSENHQLQLVDMFSHDRILARVAFFPEQIAERVVEGMGGEEILAQGRNQTKDGHKAKGDLEQWKVLLL